MSITKARALVLRHHKYAWVLTIAAALAVGGTYFIKNDLVSAATYYFTQASWAGGASATTATHTGNQSGWTTYESASSTLTAGTTLSLAQNSYSAVDASDTGPIIVTPSGGPAVSGGGFGNGATSSTAVIGSGSGASVQLNVEPSSTGADGAVSVTAGACSGTYVSGTAPNCTIEGGTHNYTTFFVDANTTLTVTGTTGLVAKATGIVTINGTINADGGAGQNGNDAVSPAVDYGGGGGGGGGLIKIISNEQITIASTGIISANGGAGGFVVVGGIVGTVPGGTAGAGGSAGGNAGQNGFGSGGGPKGFYCGDGFAASGSGGGHGGAGGVYSGEGCFATTGIAYDDAAMGGSGGGGGNTGNKYATPGGGGSGGKIEVISKANVVNGGIIRANGGAGGGASGGGGGGGRINLSDSDGVVAGTATATLGTGGNIAASAGVVAQLTQPIYLPTGTFESASIDLGAGADFATMSWTPISQPAQTGADSLKFQLATSNSASGPWTYYGPSGTAPVGLWNMNNNWNDSSGNGNNGTAYNGATFNTTGQKLGAAAGEFGPSTDTSDYKKMEVADNSTLDLNYNTVEAWVYPTRSHIAWESIAGKFPAINQADPWWVYGLTFTDAGKIRYCYSEGTHRCLYGTTVLPLNSWTHVVGTYDGANVKLYVNNTLENSAVFTAALMNGSGPFGIANAGDFDGLIDEVAIYNRALSAAEIANHYNSGAGRENAAYYTTAAGQNIWSGHDGSRYLRYKAYLSTANIAYTPTLNDITFSYSQNATSGGLISSAYDSESDANIIGGLVWTEDATLPAGSSATLYVRTASNSAGLSSASWSTGITSSTSGCSKSGTTVTCTATAIPAGLKDGSGDRWFQYRIVLGGDGVSTPTVDDIKVVYVVNGPPAFDATYGTNGVTVSQISDPVNANWGKVEFSYKIKDEDTTTGTTNAGYVTPSFEYSINGGSSWTAIPSGDLATGATANKVVSEGSYATYSTVWTATSTLSGANAVGIANAKVRVTINDNEMVNNTANAASANFTLDTSMPAVNSGNFTLNSSTGGATAGTLTLTATDYSTLQYRFCNDSAFPATDNSCAWTTLGASPVASTTASWVTVGYPSTETVYAQVRDLYGNVTAQTAVAPAMPANVDYKDVSNVNIEVYREFLSWGTFTATTGNAFGSYKVYHATTISESTLPASGDYTLLATITDSAINYYTHNVTTATSSAQHYKVVAVGTDGDISESTAVLSDIPNGTGGQMEQAPTITDTPTADLIKNTSARIAFTTDVLATSTVEYGTSLSYGLSAVGVSFTKSHGVYLNNLTTNTQYYFRAKAGSVGGQVSEWKTGSTYFQTASGPVITGITPMNITDKTATIFWNTHASSTSAVYYASSRTLLAAGGTLVAGADADTAGTSGLYQHQVGLPGGASAFTPGSTYYFYVKSTSKDGQSLTTTDDNNGQYYTFTTTLDTTAPTISGIEAAVVAPNSAVVVWTTDEPATSQVRYGTGTGVHGKRTETDMAFANIPSYTVYHVATLSAQTSNIGDSGGTNALSVETPYYYTVVSADAAGNTTESAEQTFTTTKTGETVVVTRRVTAEAEGGTAPDTTAPTISNVKVSDITPFSAVVTFDTNEAAVGKLAYGKDTGYGDNAADDFSWGTSHTIKLRGLTLGTEYHIKVSAADRAGNVGTSDDQTFKTSFLSENIKELTKIENIEQFQKEIEETIESILPSLVPPFVSKPAVADITENSATVTFRTNIRSFPLVGFVEDATYNATAENPYSSEVSDTTEKNTSHTLSLLNLKSNTKYHIQARAFSLPQVVGKTDDLTFITKASKIIASIVETKRDSFTVVWITDEPTTSTVEYKNLATGITERKTDSKQTASHSMKIENLPSATTYEVIISGVNAEGNVIEGGSPLRVTTSKDVTAPALSNFKVSNAMVPGRTDRIQTIISWTTDEPADSIVYYEEGIGTPGDEKELVNKSEITDSFVTSHNIIISSLKPGAIYRIKVTSTDDSGNMGVFGPRTIITPKQTESITDIIFKNFEDSFKFLRNF